MLKFRMSMKQQMLNSQSEEATRSAGRKLAQELIADWADQGFAPILVLLSGDYGVGKTQFVKGMAVGLGITDLITSPSYTYMQEYDFTIPGQSSDIHGKLAHVDAWRVNSIADLEMTGLTEQLVQNRIVVMEWGNKFGELKTKPGVKVVEVVISETQINSTGERKIEVRYL